MACVKFASAISKKYNNAKKDELKYLLKSEKPSSRIEEEQVWMWVWVGVDLLTITLTHPHPHPNYQIFYNLTCFCLIICRVNG
jgi:hypothetical protein